MNSVDESGANPGNISRWFGGIWDATPEFLKTYYMIAILGAVMFIVYHGYTKGIKKGAVAWIIDDLYPTLLTSTKLFIFAGPVYWAFVQISQRA